MNRTLRFAAASLALILLAACGAKGPLFLPPQAPPVEVVEPATDAPADAQATPPADSAPATDSSTPPVTPPTTPGTP